jgi:RIO-like serine/threonine protein kinase
MCYAVYHAFCYPFFAAVLALRKLTHFFEAHRGSFEYAQILHCDVSEGTAIIGRNGNGILIDWDLSVYPNDNAANRA